METRLSREAFSPEGYIVHQAQCGGLRYGVWRSDRNGCGWIAVYNLLRAAGRGQSAETVARGLLRFSLLRGLIGTRLIAIYAYLRRRGLRLRLAAGQKRVCALAEGAPAGILLYRHRGGWHYVCFLPEGETGALRFLNAWRGPRDPACGMAAFLETNARSRLALALAIEPSSVKCSRRGHASADRQADA
ncbi:MAG: hypothetical protein Q4C13_07550 [Clostridia bacterium]|nr:hypothetical protein [Clostridia bacterium]